LPKNPDAINLGSYEVEIEEDPKYGKDENPNNSKNFAPFVNQKGEVLDRSVIESRILSLKLMFDDTQQLRKQKEFLNKSGGKATFGGDEAAGAGGEEDKLGLLR